MKINTILIVVFALLGIVLVAGAAGSVGSIGGINGVNIFLFILGLVSIGSSYIGTVYTYNGYLADPDDLNEKIIYRIEGQIKTSDGNNTVVVRNATGKGCIRWVENPEPLAPDTRFVKVVKIEGEKRGYKFVPLTEPGK